MRFDSNPEDIDVFGEFCVEVDRYFGMTTGPIKEDTAGMLGEGFGTHEQRNVVSFLSENRSDKSTDCSCAQNEMSQAASPQRKSLASVFA